MFKEEELQKNMSGLNEQQRLARVALILDRQLPGHERMHDGVRAHVVRAAGYPGLDGPSRELSRGEKVSRVLGALTILGLTLAACATPPEPVVTPSPDLDGDGDLDGCAFIGAWHGSIDLLDPGDGLVFLPTSDLEAGLNGDTEDIEDGLACWAEGLELNGVIGGSEAILSLRFYTENGSLVPLLGVPLDVMGADGESVDNPDGFEVAPIQLISLDPDHLRSDPETGKHLVPLADINSEGKLVILAGQQLGIQLDMNGDQGGITSMSLLFEDKSVMVNVQALSETIGGEQFLAKAVSMAFAMEQEEAPAVDVPDLTPTPPADYTKNPYPDSDKNFLYDIGGEGNPRDRIRELAPEFLGYMETYLAVEIERSGMDANRIEWVYGISEQASNPSWVVVLKDINSGKFLNIEITQGTEAGQVVRPLMVSQFTNEFTPQDDFFDFKPLDFPQGFGDLPLEQKLVGDDSGWFAIAATLDGEAVAWWNANAGEWYLTSEFQPEGVDGVALTEEGNLMFGMDEEGKPNFIFDTKERKWVEASGRMVIGEEVFEWNAEVKNYEALQQVDRNEVLVSMEENNVSLWTFVGEDVVEVDPNTLSYVDKGGWVYGYDASGNEVVVGRGDPEDRTWVMITDRYQGKYLEVTFGSGMNEHKDFENRDDPTKCDSLSGGGEGGTMLCKYSEPGLIRMDNEEVLIVPWPEGYDSEAAQIEMSKRIAYQEDLDDVEWDPASAGELYESLAIRAASLFDEEGRNPKQLRDLLSQDIEVLIPIPGSDRFWILSKGVRYEYVSFDRVGSIEPQRNYHSRLRVDDSGRLIITVGYEMIDGTDVDHPEGREQSLKVQLASAILEAGERDDRFLIVMGLIRQYNRADKTYLGGSGIDYVPWEEIGREENIEETSRSNLEPDRKQFDLSASVF